MAGELNILKKELLTEKWHSSIEYIDDEGNKIIIEIFINPSKREISKFYSFKNWKEVKFSLDSNTGNIYAWGEDQCYHEQINSSLKLKSTDVLHMYYINGEITYNTTLGFAKNNTEKTVIKTIEANMDQIKKSFGNVNYRRPGK